MSDRPPAARSRIAVLGILALAVAGAACASKPPWRAANGPSTPTAASAAPAGAPAAARATLTAASRAALVAEVSAAERAFAKTMADRDHAAFSRMLADEAVFFAGPGQVLRGREAVAAGWKRYFETPAAPFSWDPDETEVLESGTLALTSGPVRDPSGTIVGRFNSIWQRQPDGRWRVLFDKGERPCRCASPAPAASAAPRS